MYVTFINIDQPRSFILLSTYSTVFGAYALFSFNTLRTGRRMGFKKFF